MWNIMNGCDQCTIVEPRKELLVSTRDVTAVCECVHIPYKHVHVISVCITYESVHVNLVQDLCINFTLARSPSLSLSLSKWPSRRQIFNLIYYFFFWILKILFTFDFIPSNSHKDFLKVNLIHLFMASHVHTSNHTYEIIVCTQEMQAHVSSPK